MDEYDLAVIGTGSGMNLVGPFLQRNSGARVAVIEKDQVGGICLTRGCIPTKLLVQAADVVRTIQSAGDFGIEAPIRSIDFARIMKAMREHVDGDSQGIREALEGSDAIDFFADTARFVAPRTLQVGSRRIKAKRILLCIGSRPYIPPIEGIADVPHHTSDSILHLTERPESMVIIGGGYIAAEFGHFFSAMGAKVTILGRNPQFLPEEEPEVSEVVLRQMRRHMRIETGVEVLRASRAGKGVRLEGKGPDGPVAVEAEVVLVAAGRASNAHLLDPKAGGLRVDRQGWLVTDDRMRTEQEGVYAIGDANGRHMFKHKANSESLVLWQSAFLGDGSARMSYGIVPRAVFTHPQVAAVGLGEKAAVERYGRHGILVGLQRYEDTAKGKAMHSRDHFVKVIVRREDQAILGAHIVGPEASTLIQEVITLMHAPDATMHTLREAMHIHPALPEVVDRAFGSVEPLEDYHHRLEELGLRPGTHGGAAAARDAH